MEFLEGTTPRQFLAGGALATDGNLSQAHMSLAYASFTYDWDWPDATKHFDHAIALDREAVPAFSENPVVIVIG